MGPLWAEVYERAHMGHRWVKYALKYWYISEMVPYGSYMGALWAHSLHGANNCPTLAKVHCEPKKHIKMFLSYLLQNQVDSLKIWYTLYNIVA